MIIGVDLEKDERVLHDAYNDAAGVTARFNLNLLVRINRELGGNFDVSGFTHRAIYNREQHRIEMHLISRKAQTVRLCSAAGSRSAAGESIHTENSYKYSIPRFTALARGSGWRLRQSWTDAKPGMFSVHALVASDLRARKRPDLSPIEIASQAATTSRIAVVSDRQHQRRQAACEPGQDAERDNADAMRQLKTAANRVLEQDGPEQEQQRSADRAQHRLGVGMAAGMLRARVRRRPPTTTMPATIGMCR